MARRQLLADDEKKELKRVGRLLKLQTRGSRAPPELSRKETSRLASICIGIRALLAFTNKTRGGALNGESFAPFFSYRYWPDQGLLLHYADKGALRNVRQQDDGALRPMNEQWN